MGDPFLGGGLFVEDGADLAPFATFYVDLNSTASTEDGSIATPFKTMQAGIDAAFAVAGNRALVVVRPGLYAEDVNTPTATVTKFIGIQGSGRLHPASVRTFRINPPSAGTLQLSVWQMSFGSSAAPITRSPMSIGGAAGNLFFNFIDSSVLSNANFDTFVIDAGGAGNVSVNNDHVQIFPSGATVSSALVAAKGSFFGRAELTGIAAPAVVLSGTASINLNASNIITSGGVGIDAITNAGTGPITLGNVAIFLAAVGADAIAVTGVGVTVTIGNAFLVLSGGAGGISNPFGAVAFGVLSTDAGVFPTITTAFLVPLAIPWTRTTGVVALGVAADNVGIGTSSEFGSGAGVIGLANAPTLPSTNPTGGGVIYAEAGAGKFRGSGGTITTFGPAEPHCNTCGRDCAVEWVNEAGGWSLAVCLWCLTEKIADAGVIRKVQT